MSIKYVLCCLLFLLSTISGYAQQATLDNKVNDALRSGNKFYAVVAVLVTIFTVLFAYMVYQDIKLNRIKKDLNSKFPNNNE